MSLTRRSDYACRILRAVYKAEGVHVSVAQIAREEEIPYAFARSIQHDLVKSGLMKTARGAHGGLALNREPNEVTVLEVLEAVQGVVVIASCVADPTTCSKSAECAYNRVWCGVDRMIRDYLEEITLAELFKMGGDHPAIMKATRWETCEVADCGDSATPLKDDVAHIVL